MAKCQGCGKMKKEIGLVQTRAFEAKARASPNWDQTCDIKLKQTEKVICENRKVFYCLYRYTFSYIQRLHEYMSSIYILLN